MPDVPNVPGVPPLTSYSTTTFGLVLSDVASFVQLALPSPWGVFLGGQAIIMPASVLGSFAVGNLAPLQSIASLLGVPNILPVIASTIEFEFKQDWPISDYPQEQGAFQSYNKVELPSEVRLKLACGGAPSTRRVFLDTCQAIAKSFDLFDIATPEIVFTSMSAHHLDWRRAARNGVQLIVVDLWFEKVQVTSTATFTTTQQPGNAGQQSIGAVQPQTPIRSPSGNLPVPSVGEFS